MCMAREKGYGERFDFLKGEYEFHWEFEPAKSWGKDRNDFVGAKFKVRDNWYTLTLKALQTYRIWYGLPLETVAKSPESVDEILTNLEEGTLVEKTGKDNNNHIYRGKTLKVCVRADVREIYIANQK